MGARNRTATPPTAAPDPAPCASCMALTATVNAHAAELEAVAKLSQERLTLIAEQRREIDQARVELDEAVRARDRAERAAQAHRDSAARVRERLRKLEPEGDTQP